MRSRKKRNLHLCQEGAFLLHFPKKPTRYCQQSNVLDFEKIKKKGKLGQQF